MRIAIAICICLLATDLYAAFPTGWGRKAELIIQSSKVTSDLSNFPVVITEANVPSEMFDAGLVRSDGGDIRFSSDAAGVTQLPAGVVKYDDATNTMEVWVKVTSISSSSNTSIWVWYDSSTTTLLSDADTYGRDNVWDANFVAVWHFEESPSSSDLIDATSNSRNSTSDDIIGTVTGIIGNAWDFGDTTDFKDVQFTDANWQDGWTEWTISAWHRPTGTDLTANRNFTIISKNSSYFFRKSAVTDGRMNPAFDDSEGFDSYTQPTGVLDFVNNTWIHVAMTGTNGAIDSVKHYGDGVYDPPDRRYISSMGNSNTALSIGQHLSGSNYAGYIDEIRLSSTSRNVSWINASFNTIDDPNAFIVEQTAEDVSGNTKIYKKVQLRKVKI